MKDNIVIFNKGPIHYDWFTYQSNKELKKRLAHRKNEQGVYELYDSISNKVIMSGSMDLSSYLKD